MIFCIFSYNRGRYLDNCVRSIELCAKYADIRIFDDDSDDPETLKYLSEIRNRYAVVSTDKSSDAKLGGLYNNMQHAINHCSGESIVCFIQDDMQLVRPVDFGEIDGYKEYFDKNPRHAFLQPCFLKGSERLREMQSLQYNGTMKIYQRCGVRQSAGTYFSAVFMASPARLLENNWRFQYSERKNDQQAKQYFDRLGYLYAPFAMWLPDVPAYRGKRKTLALRIAERRRQCDFNPYKIMSTDEVTQLKKRSPDILPFAEDFLTCATPGLPLPWSYYPLQESRWLRKLNSYELFLRRIISRL